MFQLSKEEFENWRSQIATSNSDKMGLRRRPYAFTENGVAMLSSVLTSDRAIEVNIQIMRTFTRLKTLALENNELKAIVAKIEKRLNSQESHIVENKKAIKEIIGALNKLLTDKSKEDRKIGF